MGTSPPLIGYDYTTIATRTRRWWGLNDIFGSFGPTRSIVNAALPTGVVIAAWPLALAGAVIGGLAATLVAAFTGWWGLLAVTMPIGAWFGHRKGANRKPGTQSPVERLLDLLDYAMSQPARFYGGEADREDRHLEWHIILYQPNWEHTPC